MRYIHEARKNQGKHPDPSNNLEAMIDTAWLQPYKLLKRKFGGAVEPFFDLADNQGVFCTLDLAFMGPKIGLINSITESARKRASEIGWTFLNHDQAMLA